MPLYDFQCRACARVFEFSRPMGSKALPACPSCKSKRTEKLMTPPTIHFKGSGWYKTEGRKQMAEGSEKKETKESKETKETKISEVKKEEKKKEGK